MADSFELVLVAPSALVVLVAHAILSSKDEFEINGRGEMKAKREKERRTDGGGFVTQGKERTSSIDNRSSGFFESIFFTRRSASDEMVDQSDSSYSI